MPTIIIVAVLVFWGFAFFLKLQSQQLKDLYKSKPLMIDNEKEFYVPLIEALPDGLSQRSLGLRMLLSKKVNCYV